MLEAGTTLQGGKYRIEKLLGQGGFGVTYRAAHALLGTRVVIKEYFPRQIVHRSLDSLDLKISGEEYVRDAFQQGKRTFLNEGRFLHATKHPHIVSVLDFFEENNTAYLVMEYLDGRNLKEEMISAGDGRPFGPLPDEQVTRVMEALVSALDFLHQNRIHHLDVKPSNVMVCKDGRVVLIDFGAARQGTSVATHSQVHLSLDYAPPELFHDRQFGPETDIYELGVTLHEILTATLPPSGIKRLAGQAWEPNLPEPWLTRVRSALAPKREDRPQDVRAWWNAAPAPAPAPEPKPKIPFSALTARRPPAPPPTTTAPGHRKNPTNDSRKIQSAFIGVAVACWVAFFGFLFRDALKGKERQERRDATAAFTARSVANMKELSRGLLMYRQDNDDRFPPMDEAGAFQAALLPYVREESYFQHPASRQPYETNPSLSFLRAGEVATPATTITVRDPRPDDEGQRVLAFADGHEGRFPETYSYSTHRWTNPGGGARRSHGGALARFEVPVTVDGTGYVTIDTMLVPGDTTAATLTAAIERVVEKRIQERRSPLTLTGALRETTLVLDIAPSAPKEATARLAEVVRIQGLKTRKKGE